MDKLIVTLLVLSSVGLILEIVALATPGWSRSTDGIRHNGLWQECITGAGCYGIKDPTCKGSSSYYLGSGRSNCFSKKNILSKTIIQVTVQKHYWGVEAFSIFVSKIWVPPSED